MGEDIQEYYDEYEEQFVELCKQIFAVGQKHYDIRSTEIELFVKSVEEAKKENQEESIGKKLVSSRASDSHHFSGHVFSSDLSEVIGRYLFF